jgi:formylglycine-generating enzyme required for sulfatase activity
MKLKLLGQFSVSDIRRLVRSNIESIVIESDLTIVQMWGYDFDIPTEYSSPISSDGRWILCPESMHDYVLGILVGNQLDLEMVPITGGTFQMGSTDGGSDEEPVHSVTLSDFEISKYPVTQKLWRDIMGVDPPKLRFKGCDQCPVERVSWDDVQEFLKKLNARTGKTYRLPTEAEWEYAARGGNQSQGYEYSGSNDLKEVGWYRENAGGKTHPAGRLKPNELELYDMSGNVWEWCSDWYGSDYYKNSPLSNPAGPDIGLVRVFRGGSWGSDPQYCRVAYRSYGTPSDRDSNVGFRLARTI